MFYLEQYSFDLADRGDHKTKAKGMCKKLMDHKSMYFMYLLVAIFPKITKDSLFVQKDDTIVSVTISKLENFTDILSTLE